MRAEPLVLSGVVLLALAVLPPLAPLLQSRLPFLVIGQYPLTMLGGLLIGLRLRGKVGSIGAPPPLLPARP